MTFLIRLHAGLAATLLPLAAIAHDYSAGDLSIAHPFARSVPATAQTSAGYLTIENTGDTPDRLIAVEADFPRVEIHNVTTGDDGMTMMEKQENGIEIAPGQTLALSPGGYHVMFMGLDDTPLEVGDEVPATLIFERAGSVEVVFNVEDVAANGTADHDNMDHGEMDHGDMDHDDMHRDNMDHDGMGSDTMEPDAAASE
ncbi:copper chaperone PCu(A)C [Salipiger sp. IMCC34102]|uniref:copper chaperone PCu(A)C n=1 Tax=Salipiger sp. IMCC34102 TaxID=2510647 RepID=UPI00101BCC0E|nr:copper chaperone PCu(A)C [Salipiger sp. IMCC34102]RYH01699.1 copper chaperone PCu(A)C [Salipiger sp. IMCC34102]